MDHDHLLYESAFKFAPIGMAMVSLEGKFLKVNQSLCDLVGYTEAELLSTDFQTITFAEDLEADVANVKAALAGDIQSYSMEKRYIHKDQKIVWGNLNVSLIKDDGKPQFFVSQIMDITDVKQAQLALFYNSKMIALGEMAGGLAHEINNPLTIIGLNASSIDELFKDQDIDRSRAKLFLKKITDTVARINSIVMSLRRLSSRAESAGFEKASVKFIVEDALTICFEKFKAEGVTLETHILDMEIDCRPVEISQVVVNLLNNAFHAVKKSREKKITVTTETKDDIILIEVCDTGTGVPDDIRSKIMEPFFTTKIVGEGTGLGLSISRNIVESHHGRLYLADSKVTKFIIELPIKQN